MKIKPGWFTVEVSDVNAQIIGSNCLEQADIKFRIKPKNSKTLGSRSFDITRADISCFRVKRKDLKKMSEALNALPEAQKQFLLRREPSLEKVLKA